MIKIVSIKNKIDPSMLGSDPPFKISYADKDGRFKTTDGKWGLLSSTGEILIKPTYESMALFSDGLILIKKNNKYGYLDGAGQCIIGFENEEPFLDNAKPFKNGLAEVSLRNQKYYVDYMGHFFEIKQNKKQTLLIKNKSNQKFLNILKNQLKDFHFPKKGNSFEKQAEEGQEPTSDQTFLINIYSAFKDSCNIYLGGICPALMGNFVQRFDQGIKKEIDLNWLSGNEKGAVTEWIKGLDEDKIKKFCGFFKGSNIDVNGVKKGLPNNLWFYDVSKKMLYIFKKSNNKLQESNYNTSKGKLTVLYDLIINLSGVKS